MRFNARGRTVATAWFDFLTEPQRALALRLQAVVHQVAPGATEAVRWGQLVFSVENQALMAIVPFKTSVNLQFFNGQGLPAGILPLEGAGRGSRHLRFRLNQPFDEAAVAQLVAASIKLGRWPEQAPDQAAAPPNSDRD